MAGTYSQCYIQAVFAVKRRENLIAKEWQSELNQYIAGIIRAKNNKPIIVNGVSDHMHIFFGLRPVDSISAVIRDIKNNSTNFINKKKFTEKKFQWQKGHGAFTYSHSHISRVYNYILNREFHHSKETFRHEYTQLLKKFEVSYDEKYLLDWID
jgi:putative transposase